MYTRGRGNALFPSREKRTSVPRRVTPEIVKRAVGQSVLPSFVHLTSSLFALRHPPPAFAHSFSLFLVASVYHLTLVARAVWRSLRSITRPYILRHLAKCIETIFRNGRETSRLPATGSFVLYYLSLQIPSSRATTAVLPRVSLHDARSLSPSFPFPPPILVGILFTHGRRVHDEKSKVSERILETRRLIGYRRKILRIDGQVAISLSPNRHSRTRE